MQCTLFATVLQGLRQLQIIVTAAGGWLPSGILLCHLRTHA